MRHSLSKDTAFNGETTPRYTFLYSDSQCVLPGDPRKSLILGHTDKSRLIAKIGNLSIIH